MLSSGEQWLCFVKDGGEDGSAEFDRALDIALQHKIPHRIVDFASIPETADRDAVYVLKLFGTDCHTSLQQRGCRIVGPMCVIMTLQERWSLPESRKNNVFTLAMRGAVVCCTGIGERNERDVIYNLVALMGGTVLRSLTQSVTHLLAGEVGSAKYNVAHELRIPILLTSWVDEAWQCSRTQPISAMNSDFVARHSCPPFKGCSICVTGIDADVRKDIRRLAMENGGAYAGELNMETTTHLVAEKPIGEKYKHARLWGIPCVTPAWFFKSIESSGCENVKKYEVEPGSTDPLVAANCQGNGNDDVTSHEGSRKRKRPADAQDNQPPKRLLVSRSSSGGVICTEVPRQYSDLVVKPCSMPFLDGCKILLHGYGGAMLEMLRRIINCGGGTRFNQLNATVSHVILDHASSDIRQRLEAIQGVRPHVVSSAWLLECYRTESRVSEDSFPCPGMGLEGGQGGTAADTVNTLPRMPAPSLPPPPAPATMEPVSDASDRKNILAQYMTVSAPSSSVSATSSSSTAASDCGAPAHHRGEVIPGNGVFSSLLFCVDTRDATCNALASKIIQNANGKVVSELSGDGFLVNCLSAQRTENVRQVTLFWLEKCASSGQLLPSSSESLFEPCGFDSPADFMAGTVLSLSQYEGQLRSQLSKLAISMGATVQDHFVRKVSKGLKASTHLLCQTASGSKFSAAQRWSLPPVSHTWLLMCSKTKSVVPEAEFLVSETAPGRAYTPSEIEKSSKPAPPVSSANVTTTVSVAAPFTATAPVPARPVVGARLQPFQPAFDTADAVAALQSPAVTAARKQRNRSSGIAMEVMFQTGLASAVNVCSAASATENVSTVVEKAPSLEAAPLHNDKVALSSNTPSRRSGRRGKRHVKMSLEGVSVHPVSVGSQQEDSPQDVSESARKMDCDMTDVTVVKHEVTSPKAPENPPAIGDPTDPGTLEVREAFEKEMESLMALTSNRSSSGSGRTSVRRSSRLSRNGHRGSPAKDKGMSPTTDGSPASSNTANVAGPSFGKMSSSSSGLTAGDHDQVGSDPMTGGESSQTEMITYDDPNGRLVRERIIAGLKEAPDIAGDVPPLIASVSDRTSSAVFPMMPPDEEAPASSAGNVSVATPTPPVPVPMIAALRPVAKSHPPLATEDLTVSQNQTRAAQLKFHLTALSQAVSLRHISFEL